MTYVYDQERGLAVPKWTTACPDWGSRIIEGRPLINVPVLFKDTADNYMSLFGALPLGDVRGNPLMRDATKLWAWQFAEVFFGSLCLESNIRLITEYFMLISKKNTKSTLAAAIMLTIITRCSRGEAEYTLIAPTKTVADNAFKPVMSFIKSIPELSQLLHVQEHFRTVTHRVTGTSLKVMAADKDSVGGSKSAGVLIDELWIFGSMSRAAGVLSEATGGLVSQDDGFIINLTTQSEIAPAGVFASKLNYARGVRDGKIDNPHFLPVIYEHPKSILDSKAHLEPKNFYMTNPNIGASVSQRTLERMMSEAEEKSIEEYTIFLAKHLNVQVGLSLKGESWVAARHWEQATVDKSDLATIVSECEVATVGVDGGGLDDLFSISVVGRVRGSRTWLHWTHNWVHRSVLELRKADAPTLLDMEKAGDLTIIDRIGEEVDQASAYILMLRDKSMLGLVGVDPNRITALLDALSDAGITKDEVIGISQGWRLHAAMTLVERKLADGTFKHGGQKIMQWAMSNAKTEPRGNAVLITKEASGRGKIDSIMSMLNASQLMGDNPAPRSSIDESIKAWNFSEAI